MLGIVFHESSMIRTINIDNSMIFTLSLRNSGNYCFFYHYFPLIIAVCKAINSTLMNIRDFSFSFEKLNHCIIIEYPHFNAIHIHHTFRKIRITINNHNTGTQKNKSLARQTRQVFGIAES